MKITDKNFITDDDSQEFLLMNMAPENESEVRGFEFLINSPVDYNSEILIYVNLNFKNHIITKKNFQTIK